MFSFVLVSHRYIAVLNYEQLCDRIFFIFLGVGLEIYYDYRSGVIDLSSKDIVSGFSLWWLYPSACGLKALRAGENELFPMLPVRKKTRPKIIEEEHSRVP